MESLAPATLTENDERDFADEVLARIEERESEVRATLERLIKQRAAISRGERDAAWDVLRAKTIAARGELRRLRLLASMADALLGPVSLRPRSRPAPGTTIR
jgi:hypothetical protein